jgi:hypothetical protein
MWRRLLLLCLLVAVVGCMEGSKPEPLKRVSGSNAPNGVKPPLPRQP